MDSTTDASLTGREVTYVRAEIVCDYCKHQLGPASPAEHHGVGDAQLARIERAVVLLNRAAQYVASRALTEEIAAWLDDELPWENG